MTNSDDNKQVKVKTSAAHIRFLQDDLNAGLAVELSDNIVRVE